MSWRVYAASGDYPVGFCTPRVLPIRWGGAMFDHVTIWASDIEASRRFYNTVLAPLRLPVGSDRDFRLVRAEETASATSGLHVGFVTRSRDEVDAFWRSGVDAGYQSDVEPGPRPQYAEDYYGGFLLDPDGNSAEAVNFEPLRAPGSVIDHLWIRVADLAEPRRFWDTEGPTVGLAVYGERPERVGAVA
ncbi:MAG: VOC family protein [Actinomycetota bacterium]|nr:VOC family protein [Actinomycetota bacterium]